MHDDDSSFKNRYSDSRNDGSSLQFFGGEFMTYKPTNTTINHPISQERQTNRRTVGFKGKSHFKKTKKKVLNICIYMFSILFSWKQFTALEGLISFLMRKQQLLPRPSFASCLVRHTCSSIVLLAR